MRSHNIIKYNVVNTVVAGKGIGTSPLLSPKSAYESIRVVMFL